MVFSAYFDQHQIRDTNTFWGTFPLFNFNKTWWHNWYAYKEYFRKMQITLWRIEALRHLRQHFEALEAALWGTWGTTLRHWGTTLRPWGTWGTTLRHLRYPINQFTTVDTSYRVKNISTWLLMDWSCKQFLIIDYTRQNITYFVTSLSSSVEPEGLYYVSDIIRYLTCYHMATYYANTEYVFWYFKMNVQRFKM